MGEITFFIVAGAWAAAIFAAVCVVTAVAEFVAAAMRSGVPFGWLGRWIRSAKAEREINKPLETVRLTWRKK